MQNYFFILHFRVSVDNFHDKQYYYPNHCYTEHLIKFFLWGFLKFNQFYLILLEEFLWVIFQEVIFLQFPHLLFYKSTVNIFY